ncbi:reverse transcriptase domain-containing protein [Tanacetum coccineum]
MKGETLMMYLAAVDEAVSGVLLTKRDGRKMPIHYVSRSLQGAKTNHAPIEKLTLAIVHTARRLRRYFQAHLIKVIIDSPIKQVLSNSEASGRLAKWAVELGAYGIKYVPKVAVKGKSYSWPKGIDTIYRWSIKQWMVWSRPYPDSSRRHRILLRTLFDFSNSNNDAEYEALLAGLWIAIEMQVKYIHAFVDSKLVASQVEGSYEAKGEKMIKYREKVLELAGVQFDHLSKEVLVEVLNERYVKTQEVNMVVEKEGPTWMTPIRNYLEKGMLPEDHVDARTLMEKIGNYTLEDGVIMHDGPRQVVAKSMNLGYYCSFIHRDARELIRAM